MASLKKRNGKFYIQHYAAGRQQRVALHTDNLQLAKEKLRQFESADLRGQDNPLPTRTPIAQVLTAYVAAIRARKTAKAAQTDIYYLREMFGPVCDAVTITSRSPGSSARKRPPKKSQVDGRKRMPTIEAACFEAITPAQVAAFIDFKVRDQGLKPKTANHYRSILRRVFNWATQEHGIRMPSCGGGRTGDNPAAKVRPYKEQAPEIRFLTLAQVDEQLHALRFKPQLQTMVAMLIYAGLRREELCWLTLDDIDLSRRVGGHGLIRVRAKTIDGRHWQPKTRVNRAVPISRALRDYLDRYTPPATVRPTPDANFPGWFFPSPSSGGGGWWDPDNFSADLRDANRDAALQWSSLDYRHTFGSQLAQRGVSLYKIATLMGNSPEICRRHYAALIPDAMTEDVEFASRSSSLGLTAAGA
jgi:integrase